MFSCALATLVLASCSDIEKGEKPGPNDGADEAYVSINVESKAQSRASGENLGENESGITALYLLTFNSSGYALEIPKSSPKVFYTEILPEAGDDYIAMSQTAKISGSSNGMLVIANPGTKLLAAIRSVSGTTTYNSFNKAITEVLHTEITDTPSAAMVKGFAMINSATLPATPAPGNVIESGLIDISAQIKIVGETYPTEQEAKEAAEANKITVKIERLASKIALKVKVGGVNALPAGAKFTFGGWVLDVINTEFYPWAKQTLLTVSHAPQNFYTYNFYTEDPNYSIGYTNPADMPFTYNTVNTAGDYAPVIQAPYGDWSADEDILYCIENTMLDTKQLWGTATRVIIKGTYYPETDWDNDWFHFDGVNYETLGDLKAAYTVANTADPDSPLALACKEMLRIVNITNNAPPAADFIDLTQVDLDNVPNGGEQLKREHNPANTGGNAGNMIRWYQDGLSYYYYEIRHDNEATTTNGFAKYGMVRNNWYSLTLGKVNGAGTPWYPDVTDPGPGDPDPTDPIDDTEGFLGMDIEVGPWIIWSNEIEI